jgi:glycosyltransferase involved in cell wall biosynthesis
MRICCLYPDLGVFHGRRNGASPHFYLFRNLMRSLAALGHEVLALTPPLEAGEGLGVPAVPIRTPETYAALLSDDGRRLARGSGAEEATRRRLVSALGHVWNNIAVERVLLDVLPDYRPDLLFEVYSPFGVAGGLMAKRSRVRHMLNVHAPLAWEGARYRRQALTQAAEALEHIAFAATSLVVTNSRELREQLVQAGVSGPKIEVVINGVDVDLFSTDGPAMRKGLENKVVLGFAGSLKAWHGIDVLAEAFRLLTDDDRFHLLIVGDGPLAGDLKALAEALPGRVTLSGAVPQQEVPAYIRAMDIAVAPYPPLERFYFSPLKVLE